MTLAVPTGQSSNTATRTAPPLESGDQLSRDVFEARYSAHPEIDKAELVEGMVYVASPVGLQHGSLHARVIGWLFGYAAAVPQVEIGDNSSVRLDARSVVQPDAFLRLPAPLGGRSEVSEDGYLEGPPELVVEVAGSSAAYDLHDKLEVYRRTGVREYLVVTVHEREIRWYRLEQDEYREIEIDTAGRLHSAIFAGLWLDPRAFWRDDKATLLSTLREGLASDEHVAFVASLAHRSR